MIGHQARVPFLVRICAHILDRKIERPELDGVHVPVRVRTCFDARPTKNGVHVPVRARTCFDTRPTKSVVVDCYSVVQ